jgi:antirestriction protein ArdC
MVLIMSKRSSVAVDKFELVSQKLFNLLEAGVKPWQRPWVSPRSQEFRNVFSEQPYTGVNPLLCAVDCLASGYSSGLFVGFHQAKEKGWAIRKGSKSTWICWGGSYSKENEDGAIEHRRSFKWLNVFNLDCVDDSEADLKVADLIPPQESRPEPVPILELSDLLDRSGADIRYGGDRAFYSSAGDFIGLPQKSSFVDSLAYYSTAIHELTHWTGHPNRLDRKLANKFGSRDYAYEELIAEMGSAMVLSHYGHEQTLPNHASYLDSWLQALKGDKRYFFDAALQATKAANFLLG